VYAIAGGKIARRVVTLGVDDEDQGLVQIRSGVAVGERVIVGPVEGVADDAPVEVVGAAADSARTER
jgi:hypothetical protein